MKNDIKNIADIRFLVDSFYKKVREDLIIGPFFNTKVQNWESHLEKMYSFWQTLLLNEYTYKGQPFPLHAPMQLLPNHFEQWLELWYQTVDQNFTGQNANAAKDRGGKMAVIFLSKIEYSNHREI